MRADGNILQVTHLVNEVCVYSTQVSSDLADLGLDEAVGSIDWQRNNTLALNRG